MWHYYQYQKTLLPSPLRKWWYYCCITHSTQTGLWVFMCVCWRAWSNCTRGQPLHKHHILHKHRRGTWLNAAMEAWREKGRAGEKVSSPAVAPSNRIPFKGTGTPDNLPRAKQTCSSSSGPRQVKAHFLFLESALNMQMRLTRAML